MIRSFLLLALGAALLVGIADYVATDKLRLFLGPRLNVVLVEDGEQVRAYVPEERWCRDPRVIEVFKSSWWEREAWCEMHGRPAADKDVPVYEVVGWTVMGIVLAMAGVVVIPLAVLFSGVVLIMYYGMIGESYLWAALGAIWQLVAIIWFHQMFLAAPREVLAEENELNPESAESAAGATWADRVVYGLERSVYWLEHSPWTNGWRYWAIVVVAVVIYSYFKYFR